MIFLLNFLGIINGLGIILLIIYLTVTTRGFDLRKDQLCKFGTLKKTAKTFNTAIFLYGFGQFVFIWQIFRFLNLTNKTLPVLVLILAAIFTSAIGVFPSNKNKLTHDVVATLSILLSSLIGWILDYYLLQVNFVLGGLGFLISLITAIWLVGYWKRYTLKTGNVFFLLVLIFLWNLIFTLALVF